MCMRMQISIYRQMVSMYIGKKVCLNLLVYFLLFIGVWAQPSRDLLFHPDTVDLTCHVCNASHFCKYGHRYKCPEHSLAPDPSASTIEECICVPGYLREGDHCHLGTPPYYYEDGLQFSCGNNRVTVTAGASLKSQCVCPPGTEGEPGGDVACLGCAADFYNEEYNASCVQCAVHSSHSQTKSRNATDCLCDAGFTGPNGGPCTACAAGSFKTGAGSAACILCGTDEYSLGAAATCQSCHANSSSQPGSDELADCECNAGFGGVDGGPCVLCAVGKFKDSIANEACSDCLDDSFSEFEGATSCVSCLDSSAHSTGRDRCLCNAGYTQANTVDTRPDCTPCAANTYQSGSGETSCFECDANANGPEASATPVTCFCNAGFYDTGDHTCDSCAAGTYKEAAVSAETDELKCVSCPVNSHSPMQSVVVTDCICDAGFSGPDGGACTACLPGEFKAANGSAACQACDENFYSDVSAATTCESCVEFLNSDGTMTMYTGSDESNDCKCDLSAGFLEIQDANGNRTCSGCQAGTYATSNGCQNCTGGQFADVAGLTVCKDCPANSSSYDYPHVACQCHVGYYCPASADDIPQKSFQFGNSVNWVTAFQNVYFEQTYGADILPEATESEIDAEWAHITSQTSFCDDDITPFATDPYQWGVSARESFLFNILDYWPNGDRGLSCNQPSPYLTSKQDACYDIIRDLTEEKGPCQLRTCSDTDRKSITSRTGGASNVMCKNYNDVKMKENFLRADNIDWTEVVVTYVTHKETGFKYLAYLYYLKGLVDHEDSTKIFISIPTYFISNPFQTYADFLAHNHVGGVDLQGESVESSSYSDYYSDNVLPGILKDASGQSLWELGDEFSIQITSEETNTVPVVQTSGCLCSACPMDSFKNYTGGASECDVCQDNSQSVLASASQDACECDAGYYEEGSFAVLTDRDAEWFCVNHPGNSWMTLAYCLAQQNWYETEWRSQFGQSQNPDHKEYCEWSANLDDDYIVGLKEEYQTACEQPDFCTYCTKICHDMRNDCVTHYANMYHEAIQQNDLQNTQTQVERCWSACQVPDSLWTGSHNCQRCAAGFVNSELDADMCIACPRYTYTQTDQTSIESCLLCGMCPSQQYDAARDGLGCGGGSPLDCQDCPPNSRLSRENEICVLDQYNQVSEQDLENCGYRNNGIESCVCEANYYGGRGTQCTACPANSERAFSDSNSSIADCLCSAGFEPDPALAHECRACPVNTYKTGPGDYSCTPCPSTMVTESEGADNLATCVCPPGYYFDSDDGICLICNRNTFKTEFSRQLVCDACVNHSVSAVGSDENSDCLCQRGFGHVGGPATTISYYMSRWRDRNTNRMGRILGNVLAPLNEIAQASYWKQVSGYYGRNANKGKSVSRMNELQQFITTPCYTDARAQASYYSISSPEEELARLSDIADELAQTPCTSNHNGVLYETSNPKSHSCMWMPIEYTRGEVTSRFPGVVYLDRTENGHSYYYQFFLRVYIDISYLEHDWRTLNANDCRFDVGCSEESYACTAVDPTVIGGGSAFGWGWGNVPTTLFVAPAVDFACEICLPGEQKNVTANEGCDVCEVDTFAANSGTHVCEECATGKSTNGFTGKSYCECNAGTERESSNVLSDCQDCAEGKFKTDASYEEPYCQNCSRCVVNEQVDTVCSRSQDITCKACQPNSWSQAGRTKVEPCFCDAGYELIGEACVACTIGKARTTNGNNSIACETCQDGKFADTQAATECQFCAAHCNATISVGSNLTYNTYVTEECEATSDTVCAACTACPPGQYAIQSCGIPFNNDRNDTKCALCPAGSYCPGGMEGDGVDVQPIVCQDNALSAPGSDEEADCSCNPGYYGLENVCTLCEYDFYCPGSGVTVACPAHSITRHRGSSQRLDCHCLAGFYRSPADEAKFNCSLCTPNDYCYNNSLYNCSDARMLAEPGSSSPEDCVCMDGFYNTGTVCTECAVDHFCVGGVQTACVANEWTNGQAGQAECLCRPGLARGAGGRQYAIAVPTARCHYTQSVSQTTLEECKEVCTNQLCPGFYYYSEFLNLGFGPVLTSLCGMCAFPQHFVNGTVGQRDTDATSVLDPQLLTFLNGTGITGQHDIYAPLPATTCGTCTENFFCDGSDDAEHACPVHSVSAAGSSSRSDCLCVAGFEHVHPVNASEPHTCRSCVDGSTFKTEVGNHVCGQCTVCSANIDFVYQGVACAPTHDATCIPCTVCSQTGDRYETSRCQDFVDTQCAACQQCNFTTHFISQECFELSNRECTAIAYDLQCVDGQYAGGHTTHTQTRCLPCRYNDTLYVGAHLHVSGSPGRVYNDPYSCKSACLPFSQLRNTEAHYLGCETCETGNVLFKVFQQDPSHVECRFACLPGFEKSRNNTDCTLGALSASDQNFAHHVVNVSRIDRPATLGDDASGFTLTVVHTKHSRFVVVVGAGEPTCTGRESRVVADDCCYSNLWRVSQTSQMGLPVDASEHCSKNPPLPAARLDDTTLSFSLPDRRLEEVASCVQDNGRLDCTLTVSIVDLILFSTYSVPVHVSRVGSTMLAASGQLHRYVPLSKLRVEVYVAFATDAGVVLLVTTDLQASEHALTVSVHGVGLSLTNSNEQTELRSCARHSIGAADVELAHVSLHSGEAATFSTFLLSPGGLPEFCTLRYTLDLGADSVMQVAVWRNLSLHSVLCVDNPELSVDAGIVQISHGLGAAAIYNRVVLPTPESTIYGRLGMLSTFVATATLQDVTHVQLTALLAAHALPSAQHLLKNTTFLHNGMLDFRPQFRSACRASTTCDYQYLQYDPLHRGMFLFSDCSATTQTLAKTWIKQVLGVPHDDGHVTAICEAASNGPPFLAALVNTHAYMNSLHAQWNFFQDWTASTTKTALFALFKFV